MKYSLLVAISMVFLSSCSSYLPRNVSSSIESVPVNRDTCQDLSDSSKEISAAPHDLHRIRQRYPTPAGQSEYNFDLMRFQQIGIEAKADKLYRFIEPNLKLICGNISRELWDECASHMLGTFSKIVECHGNRLPLENNRAIATSFMRNPQIQRLSLLTLLGGAKASLCQKDPRNLMPLNEQFACLSSHLSGEEKAAFKKRLEIWEDYRVAVLAPGVKSKNESSGKISLAGLERLDLAYQKVKSIFSNLNSGRDHSAIWGAGGFVLKSNDLTVNGQFGEIDFNNPLVMIMVVDPSVQTTRNGHVSNAKGVNEVAERIGHENFHSKDFVDGLLTHQSISWSEEGNSRSRGIQKICRVRGQGSLRGCLASRPSLFSFKTGSYQASNVYEFYASMVNVWIRNKIAGKKGTYHCQGEKNRELWEEMETQMLGYVHSSCD